MQGTRNLARTCKETILFARTRGKRYRDVSSIRLRQAKLVSPTRRCHERYRDEDMQGNDTPCEEVCANDTRTRSHHERYRDEDVWEPILPRGHAKKRYSLRGRVGNDTVTYLRYVCDKRSLSAPRGDVTNDTVTSHPYWRAEPCEAGSVPYVRACSSVTIQLVHQTGTLKSKRRQQGSQKDG